RDRGGVAACAAVTQHQLFVALGWQAGASRPDVPERGGPPGATVCGYGDALDSPSQSSVVVFAVGRGATKFYARQVRASGDHRDIGGRDYRAFVVDTGFHAGDLNQLQSFFLL